MVGEMRLTQEMLFFFHIIKINFKSSFSLRASFIFKFLFVMLNNLIFFVSWTIFFGKFNAVNGWTIEHLSLMYGLVNMALGIMAIGFNGFKHMVKMIDTGELDTLLTLPRSILLTIACSNPDYSGIGIFLSGIILVMLSGFMTIGDAGIILLLVATSVMVFGSMTLIFGSLAFWFQDINRLSQDLYNVMVMLATSPNCVYKGALKFIIFTILPVGFVSNWPIEYFVQKDFSYILWVMFAAIGLLTLAIALFHCGLRRYESGSCVSLFGR